MTLKETAGMGQGDVDFLTAECPLKITVRSIDALMGEPQGRLFETGSVLQTLTIVIIKG